MQQLECTQLGNIVMLILQLLALVSAVMVASEFGRCTCIHLASEKTCFDSKINSQMNLTASRVRRKISAAARP